MAPMFLEIITAESKVFGEDVDMVVAPCADVQLGILLYHAPLMTMLRPLDMLIGKNDSATILATCVRFMEVIGNKVTILADSAERSEEIDEARAVEAVRRAEERMAGQDSDMQMERAMGAIRRAQVRLNVVRRRRSRGGGTPGFGESSQSTTG